MTNWELFLSKHSRTEIICAVSKEHCDGCFIEKACYCGTVNPTGEINAFLDAEAEPEMSVELCLNRLWKMRVEANRQGYVLDVKTLDRAIELLKEGAENATDDTCNN